jgi:hypothetical protein
VHRGVGRGQGRLVVHGWVLRRRLSLVVAGVVGLLGLGGGQVGQVHHDGAGPKPTRHGRRGQDALPGPVVALATIFRRTRISIPRGFPPGGVYGHLVDIY